MPSRVQPLQTVTRQVQNFKVKNFRQLNIGLQIRRRKCMLYCLHPPCQYETDPDSNGCDFLPKVKDYISMGKALQVMKGVPDEETAYFVATDEAAVYEEVGSPCNSLEMALAVCQ